MKTATIVLAFGLLVVSHANAADRACPLPSKSSAPWLDQSAFASTAFGTVAFTTDEIKYRVPRSGVECITLDRPDRFIEIVFNHRNSDKNAVGYISFKLYALTIGPTTRWGRYIVRDGAWIQRRDSGVETELPAFDPPAKTNDPDSGVIAKYEAFYLPNSVGTLKEFEEQFGQMHGIPKSSRVFSWDQRFEMQPSADLIDMRRVGYIRHELQRVEVAQGVTRFGDPPRIKILPTIYRRYSELFVQIVSPLGGGVTESLRFVLTGR